MVFDHIETPYHIPHGEKPVNMWITQSEREKPPNWYGVTRFTGGFAGNTSAEVITRAIGPRYPDA